MRLKPRPACMSCVHLKTGVGSEIKFAPRQRCFSAGMASRPTGACVSAFPTAWMAGSK